MGPGNWGFLQDFNKADAWIAGGRFLHFDEGITYWLTCLDLGEHHQKWLVRTMRGGRTLRILVQRLSRVLSPDDLMAQIQAWSPIRIITLAFFNPTVIIRVRPVKIGWHLILWVLLPTDLNLISFAVKWEQYVMNIISIPGFLNMQASFVYLRHFRLSRIYYELMSPLRRL